MILLKNNITKEWQQKTPSSLKTSSQWKPSIRAIRHPSVTSLEFTWPPNTRWRCKLISTLNFIPSHSRQDSLSKLSLAKIPGMLILNNSYLRFPRKIIFSMLCTELFSKFKMLVKTLLFLLASVGLSWDSRARNWILMASGKKDLKEGFILWFGKLDCFFDCLCSS